MLYMLVLVLMYENKYKHLNKLFDKLMIDFWDVSRYKYDEDTHHTATVNLNGKHTIRIEQVENSGYATLIFKLIPLKNKL